MGKYQTHVPKVMKLFIKISGAVSKEKFESHKLEIKRKLELTIVGGIQNLCELGS